MHIHELRSYVSRRERDIRQGTAEWWQKHQCSMKVFYSQQLTFLAYLLTVLLLVLHAKPAHGSCERCLNGGKLLLPNNIFGVCRCVCPDGFQGPKCQFSTRKRSDMPAIRTLYNDYDTVDEVKEADSGSEVRQSLYQYLLSRLLTKDVNEVRRSDHTQYD